jgi:hypothetical protein
MLDFMITAKIFGLILIIRVSKLASLTGEIREFEVISETVKNLVKPLRLLLCVLLLIFYVFGTIGILLFGGDIRRDSNVIMTSV